MTTEPGTEAREWRCFHCDEVFTDKTAALAHFGADELCNPACRLNEHEGRIAAALRDAENQLARYRAEDSDVDRKFYASQADHQCALRRAEEDGYNKGVRDMSRQIEELRKALERARPLMCSCDNQNEELDLARSVIDALLSSTTPETEKNE